MKNNFQKTITLECPSCKSQDLTLSHNNGYGECNSCGRKFSGGREELIRLNSDKIDDVKKQFANDATKELEKALKNAFKGNKFIKFK
ncbi:hypothetical protein [Algoriphagus sp. A40]|uniref:hypothetical protein n=1 Tax=Algoriphagus sp. A40 TaxID=1945863 RepID=UPI00098416B9|nr:hypothetical protein [Algoriphagus sp. A40]OOG77820.1 hypothetical protein B0E43_03390 [Algoriphagus sp. A40]